MSDIHSIPLTAKQLRKALEFVNAATRVFVKPI